MNELAIRGIGYSVFAVRPQCLRSRGCGDHQDSARVRIELFAVVPDARHMAISRNEAAVRIGTRKDRVWQATDRDLDNVAEWYSGIEVDALDFDQASDRCAGIFAAVRGSGMKITRAIQC